MTDLAAWIGVVVSIFNGIISGIDNRIIKKLRQENAFSAESAYQFSSIGSINKMRLRKLKSKGIVFEADTDKFYFAESAYNARKQKRRKFLLIIALIILLYLFITNQI